MILIAVAFTYIVASPCCGVAEALTCVQRQTQAMAVRRRRINRLRRVGHVRDERDDEHAEPAAERRGVVERRCDGPDRQLRGVRLHRLPVGTGVRAKIATKKGLTIGLMVVQIVLAIIGIIVLVMMFSALSH